MLGVFPAYLSMVYMVHLVTVDILFLIDLLFSPKNWMK